MEGYSYVDIFDTKGIEYLIVIGFLLLIVPVWFLLNKPVQERAVILKSVKGLSAQLLNIPKGLFYSKNHTWAYMEKSGAAKIGLDDLLLHMTGGVSVDFLKSEGEKIHKGDLLATVFQGDKKLQIKSPISGEIKKVNGKLENNTGGINADPYGKGWLSLIKPEDWKEDTKAFMMAEEAEEWTRGELLKYKDFLVNPDSELSKNTEKIMMQEGGEICDFPLADMPAEIWNKFQQKFLS